MYKLEEIKLFIINSKDLKEIIYYFQKLIVWKYNYRIRLKMNKIGFEI